MNLKFAQQYKDFDLLQEQYIKEVEGIGRVLQHQKTGLRVISIVNKDPQKVFSVAFHTPPKDNKGAPHIVEHTVCCASEQYPLKETFMALEKGSICTALNACTYPDMTMYYGASLSEKDLIGIMSVYMDMVFHPLMCKEKYLFEQEGWHYTLEEGEVEISGVVYHEMLGEYGEAVTRLEHSISETLFPTTHYRFDSGGIPEEITKLSYEELIAFYKAHYQPYQAVVYLYGDMDLEKVLSVLAESLKGDYRGDFIPSRLYTPQITLYQVPSHLPNYTVMAYPAVEEESQTLMSLSFVIGTVLDPELRIAFELLEHMLLRSSASPLAKAVIVENHLGISLGEGGYDTSRYQPVFSIQLKGAKEEDAGIFEDVVLKTLEGLVLNGIDEALIEAALHTLAFELREVDASYEPVGLQYGEMVLSSYLYGGEPFSHLQYTAHIEKIKACYKKGYFEALIKQYLLTNNHRALVVLKPNLQLEDAHVLAQKQIDAYVQDLDEAGYEKLAEEVAKLEALQMAQNTEADLQCLPQLKKSDIPIAVPSIETKQILDTPFKCYFQEEDTKGIAYIHLLFNTEAVPQKDLVYLGLLGHLLTYVGTQNQDYAMLENTINRLTGGLNCSLQAYSHVETGDYVPYLKITSKVLIEEVTAWREMMIHILNDTIFTERAKIKEIVGNIQYELQRSFEGAPEYRATRRVFAFFAPAGQYEDRVSGIGFYHFIKDFYVNFDLLYEEVMDKIYDLYHKIISVHTLLAYITAPKAQEAFLKEEVKILGRDLRDCKGEAAIYDLVLPNKSEAYCTSQKVSAIAKGFNFKAAGYIYHGSMEVAVHIIESTYLWDSVRLQGGAYGCDLFISRDGHLVTCAYCDPKFANTLSVFKGIGDFLRGLHLEERELERYIIHTLGILQTPISMEQKSERGLMYLLCGMSSEQLAQIMKEVSETSLAQISALASLFDDFAKAPYLCVVGNAKEIKKHKKYFENIID